MAHKLAVESARVTADVVEVSEFPDLIQRYRVSGVPKTVVNDREELVGSQPAHALMEAIRRALD